MQAHTDTQTRNVGGVVNLAKVRGIARTTARLVFLRPPCYVLRHLERLLGIFTGGGQ